MSESIKHKNSKLIMIIKIQSMVFLYSLVSMLSKIASGQMTEHGFLSFQFIGIFGLMFLCLAVYAVKWQQLLKKVELTTAYIHKSTTLIWSLIWSYFFFNETIHWNNLLGVIIIVGGIMLVTQDD